MTHSTCLTILGVEFDAACEFDCEILHTKEVHECWGSPAVENIREPISATPEFIYPTEDLYEAVMRELLRRGQRNNAHTRKQARFMARKIENELANNDPLKFISEGDLLDAVNG